MRRGSKVSARLQSIIDPRLEKPLLHLHAAINVDLFWKAVQDVMEAALPTCFIGLTLAQSDFAEGLPNRPRTFGQLFPDRADREIFQGSSTSERRIHRRFLFR
jgi:hypothetical protein